MWLFFKDYGFCLNTMLYNKELKEFLEEILIFYLDILLE